MYKYFCLPENKSVLNWTFCQLLYSQKNPIVQNLFKPPSVTKKRMIQHWHLSSHGEAALIESTVTPGRASRISCCRNWNCNRTMSAVSQSLLVTWESDLLLRKFKNVYYTIMTLHQLLIYTSMVHSLLLIKTISACAPLFRHPDVRIKAFMFLF